MELFELSLCSPEGVQYSGTVWQVSARNTTGMFALRAHHERFVASLPAGKLEVAETSENRQTFLIEEGLLEFKANTCTIMCEGVLTEDEAKATGSEV